MLRLRVTEEAGFTLVEAAVAGLILAIGILGSVGIFDSSRRESATGERLQIAQAIAEAELERMRDVGYADLATDGAQTWPSSGGDGDPLNRVVDGAEPQFRSTEEGTEPLVLAEPGAGIDPHSDPESVVVDGTSFEIEVYRFVSWRDVECQVLDLDNLQNRYEGLLQNLSTRLNNIAGAGGRLDALLALAIARLPGPVRARLNQLDPVTNDLRDSVLDLIDAVGALDEIDPCDADVAALDAIAETISALEPTLTALDNALSNYYAGCFGVAGIPLICPPTSNALYTTLNGQITTLLNNDYVSDVEALTDSLGEISSADHGFNTKRVTVAVVMTPEKGSGPFKPVWATSVISDPETSILGG